MGNGRQHDPTGSLSETLELAESNQLQVRLQKMCLTLTPDGFIF